jgi:hypothetical protein
MAVGETRGVRSLWQLGAVAAALAMPATARAQQLNVLPASFDHGLVEVGSGGVSQMFTLENDSGAASDLSITGFGTTGADCASFAFVFPGPVFLLPGESTTMSVAFAPDARGGLSCDAVITSNTGGVPGTTTNVAQTGTGIAGELTVSTTSVAFGDQRIGAGATAAMDFLVRNTGDVSLTVATVTLGGANPGDFALSGTLSGTLAPAASFTVSVLFDPTTVGARGATATVTSDDPIEATEDVALSGTGTAALVSVPSSIAHGSVVVNTSDDRTLTISNPGSATLTIATLGVSGAAASHYSLVSPPATPFTIAPAATRDVSVRCTPTTVGAHDAQVDVGSDSDVPPSNPSVELTCFGTKPDISVIPSADIDFGDYMVGSTSPAVTRTVANASLSTTSALTFEVAIVGPAAAEFIASPAMCISPGTCVLAPDATQDIALQFMPVAAGARTATVQIVSDDQESPVVLIELSGNGIVPGIDAGIVDAGAADAAGVDASPVDAGLADAGLADAGGPDAAQPILPDAAVIADAAPGSDAFGGGGGGGCGCSASLAAVLFVFPLRRRRRR